MELLGPTQVLFGSDFPHAEGMSGVEDYRSSAEELAARTNRSDEDVRLFMRDNALRLLGLDG